MRYASRQTPRDTVSTSREARFSRLAYTTTRRRIFISPKAKAESQYKHNQIQRRVSRRSHVYRAGHVTKCWKWYIKYYIFKEKEQYKYITGARYEHTSMYQNIVTVGENVCNNSKKRKKSCFFLDFEKTVKT